MRFYPAILFALVPLAIGASLALGAVVVTSKSSAPALEVARHGGFFVGGRPVRSAGATRRARVSAHPAGAPPLDLSGEFVRGATYVEYTHLADPKIPYALVMLPGGGLSAASFQDTPDGRPGWEAWFLAHGYSVDLVDIDVTGRSPWRAFPELEMQEPSFRNNAFLWEVFRIGPPGSYAARKAYPDSQFPVQAFGNFAAGAAPRFRPQPAEQAAAYDAVIRAICPCVLLLHSASAPPGLEAAQRFPRLIKAVVAVEPADVPKLARLSPDIPHIFLWGDHLSPDDTDPDWAQERAASKAYSDQLVATGAYVEWIDLPARSIRGNSHLLMMDRNSDEVAAIIDAALARALRAERSDGLRRGN